MQHKDIEVLKKSSFSSCSEAFCNDLEGRRVRDDLIFQFKIIKGDTDVNCDDLFHCSSVNLTRGHTY